MKKVHKTSGTDDKKLQTSLKKLNVQPIQAIEEVNMFKEDGNVIHFSAPKGKNFPSPPTIFSVNHIFPILPHTIAPSNLCRYFFLKKKKKDNKRLFNSRGREKNLVHASVPSNTFAIYGTGEDKELTELVPGILNQLGPDSLASLRKLAESYQSLKKDGSGGGGEGGNKKGEDDDDDDDDDIPDLVEGENFESKVE